MKTNINIAATPIAPYVGLLNSMKPNEKMAVALFLVDSLPGVEIVDTSIGNSMSTEDEAFLSQKLSSMTFSPRIEKLFEKRGKLAKTIDLEDERTRHILGI